MAAARRPTRKLLDCPRCGHKAVKVSDQGAWCIAFPCRWSVKWAWLSQAVTVARAAGKL